MLVGFAGTPMFAAVVLDAILAAGFELAVVLTQPDRRQGRGLRVEASPVKKLAIDRSLPVLQPESLRGIDLATGAVGVRLDVLVVAAYGLLLPRAVLTSPRFGCLNVHASLLPRWRGAAPIQRALLAGDAETGITIMQMDEGLDTGPALDVVRVAIVPGETGGTLHDKLAHGGAQRIVAVLEQLARGESIAATPQAAAGVTYARKIERADTFIEWSRSAHDIERQVRAFSPAPNALTLLGDKPVKILRAELATDMRDGNAPGSVIAADRSGLIIACGDGALRVVSLQPAGGTSMPASAFVAGRGIRIGDRFGEASKLA